MLKVKEVEKKVLFAAQCHAPSGEKSKCHVPN
jgi:hypothetical protein